MSDGSRALTLPALRTSRPVAWLDRFFGISAKQSSISTEVLAGASTFLALSYIFVVNPAILGAAGIPKSAVLFATILATGVATLAMGLWARLPFAVAPGMEMNAYVAFFVVATLGFSWQEALGLAFASSVVMFVVTVTRVREKVIACIPDAMKATLALTVALFIGLIALSVAGLVRYEGLGIAFQGFGSFSSRGAVTLYVAVAVVLLLDRLRFRAAVLGSIVVATLFAHLIGVVEDGSTATLSAASFDAVGRLDLTTILSLNALSVIVVLFLIDFYGSVAKIIGLTTRTNIVRNGRVPRMTQALCLDAGGSALGATTGTTNLTVYVESGVGIGAGGRTGLTAVVVALLTFSVFLVAPFLHDVPLVATTGALLFVAIKLAPSRTELRRLGPTDLLAMGMAAAVLAVTFAVDRAMLAAFAVYLAGGLLGRRFGAVRANPYLAASTALLAVGAVLQQLA